jgi:predicted transcriptional regulator
MNTKRQPLEMIREILNNGGSSRTQVRLQVGLTSKQMKRYLTLLVEKGLPDK